MKLNSLKLFDGFLFSDLKYLMAYSIPLTAIFGFYMGGYWLLTTPIYIFLLYIYLIELEQDTKASKAFFRNRIKNIVSD